MTVYGKIKSAYKKVLPVRTRRGIYEILPLWAKALRVRLLEIMEAKANHNEIYDLQYYADLVDPYMSRSCDAIADSLVDTFSPSSVVDVGCGTGLLLVALKNRAVPVCTGIDYSEAALAICRKRGLDVLRLDLEHDMIPESLKADIVVSTEVAEHLPESCAGRFVKALCDIANIVVLTAAEPATFMGWKGTDHANEQPRQYWTGKFKSRGFKYDEHGSQQLSSYWQQHGVAGSYYKTVMVFVGESCRNKQD
jgi:SAM-dependent methyltransferase